MALDEAIERALRVYEKEKRHAAPTEAVAQDLGYRNANNGAALSAFASLRYYGLLERPEEGKLAVSKDFESYQYAPEEKLKRGYLIQWLKNPAIFGELLERYAEGLPSEATLRFDLINKGFTPAAAEAAIAVFKRSVEFVGYYSEQPFGVVSGPVPAQDDSYRSAIDRPPDVSPRATGQDTQSKESSASAEDRIPVRLTAGRRAWLIIPTPFFEADKLRLKAQIDLLLTEEESAADSD